jgi:hypothetical protein
MSVPTHERNRPVHGTSHKAAGTRKPRRKRCDNCGKFFVKNRPNKRFCNEASKDEFWNNGGVSFVRQAEIVKKEVAKASKEIEARLTEKFTRLLTSSDALTPKHHRILDNLRTHIQALNQQLAELLD